MGAIVHTGAPKEPESEAGDCMCQQEVSCATTQAEVCWGQGYTVIFVQMLSSSAFVMISKYQIDYLLFW